MSSLDVRVGVVSWNTAELLDRCLASLPAALDGMTAEVVVVDNASSDASVAVAERHAGVRVVRLDHNAGYALAMNRALENAGARALIALNPDTVSPPASLARLVQALDRDERVGLLAPRLANDDGSIQHSVYRFPSLRLAAVANLLPRVAQAGSIGRRWWLEGLAPHDEASQVDWAIGAVHCIRSAALEGNAPYRDRWFMYVEDLDLCWRLHRHGWDIVFDPSITVTHVGNAAGSQAWGAARTARWLAATYDWYALERGAVAARAFAAFNVVGAGTRLGLFQAARHLPGGRSDLREWLIELFRTSMPVHRQAISDPRRPQRALDPSPATPRSPI